MKKIVILLLLITAASLFSIFTGVFSSCNNTENATEEEATGSLPPRSWIVPVNPDHDSLASQWDYYKLGWQTFIAINWPANPSYRGMPDSTLSLGAADGNGNPLPVVWEAWQEQYNIFLPGAINPGPWNDADSGCNGGKLGLKLLRQFSKGNGEAIDDAFDQATGQPLITQDSQYVRYEVRVNESEYDYIVTNSYFNADSQSTAVGNGTFKGFPHGNDALSQALQPWARYGATEIKASWRVFTPQTSAAIKNRYYRTRAILMDTYGNCTDTAEIGLIGLHILRLTPYTGSSWYWASFEQVDNVALQPQYGGQLPPTPTFNTNPAVSYGDTGYEYIPAAIVAYQPLPPGKPVGVSRSTLDIQDKLLDSINMVYHKLVAGTPFQYYQLVGTVNPPSPGQQGYTDTDPKYSPVTVNTPMMVNTTMETYMASFTKRSNCVTCHISGYPVTPKSVPYPYSGNYQVFTFLLGKADTARTKK